MNFRYHHVGFAVLTLLVAAEPAAAQTPEWSFDARTGGVIDIPAWLHADSLRDALGYGAGAPVSGLVVDLNRDGADDYLFQFSTDVCGSNCQWEIVDGGGRRSLGLVGGSVMFVGGQTINGFPTMHAYGHSSADSGSWGTSVFDGREYSAVSWVWLEGEAVRRLFERLKDVPRGPPADLYSAP